MIKLYALLIFMNLSAVAFAQDGKTTVHGKVSDENGSALIGVSVVEKGTTNGTTTDADGQYSISVSSDATLVFSFIGYISAEFSASNRTVVDVSLKEDSKALDEVIVVGYGTMQKKEVTGAVASINNKDFKDQPTTNLAGNLQGKLAGVNITSASGTPGAALMVNIRGASNPLYVVDGIPMLSESNSSLATSFDTDGNVVGSGQNVSSISDINPNDIASVEVLKDASAAAIYGARAANGVVLITTKRGKVGKTKFSFNRYYGSQRPVREIQFLNSQEFIDLEREAQRNDRNRYLADNSVFGPDFDPSVLMDSLHYLNAYSDTKVNTNWLHEVLKNAPIQNYELSATGGNDKTKFYVGGSYFDQSGIVINSGYKRLSARVNLDHQATDKLSFGLNFNASHSRNRRSFNDNTYTGIITNALGASPLMPARDTNGNYVPYVDYQANWLSDNPVLSANEIVAYTTNNRLLGSLFAEFKFNQHLKFRSSWSTDFSNVIDDQFFSPITADAQAVSGRAFTSNFDQLTWLNENILTYSQSFGDHNINAIAGYTMQETTSSFTGINAQGFGQAGGLKNISSAAVITKAQGYVPNQFGLESYLGRLNYDYKGKFLLAATVRVDGSSRFPKNNRYGTFPSASIGWRVSQEDWFKQDGAISDLKLRASYGLTGDQEIGNFQNVKLWSPGRYLGYSGLRLSNLTDPTLHWQTNKTIDFGLDWELYNGKVYGSVDYFKSDKTNILSNDAIPGTSGFSTITRNRGTIENRGWEVSVGALPIASGRFKWNTNFNISFIKNELTSFTNDGLLLSAYNDISPTHVMKVGRPVGTFWAVKYQGVDQQTGDALFRSKDGSSVTAENVTNDDATYAGTIVPKFFGGFNNTFNYGRFDFLIATQFSYGNKVYNLIKATYLNMGWSNEGGLDQVYANNSVEVKKRWKKPGDKTNIPRASFVNQNYVENSTQYIEDASFLRIRTVSVGYTLKLKKASWFDNVRFYAQVQNLYVFTKYSGFDPEVSSTGTQDNRTAGVDYAAYPQARTFTFGINSSF